MKVIFDHQIFAQQKYGGISRYFCELINQLSKDPSLDLVISLRYSQNENFSQFPSLDKYCSKKSHFFPCRQLVPFITKATHHDILCYLHKKLLINIHESERLLKLQNFDIFHPTYYNPYFLKYLQQKPFVLTVYDMIHEIFPDYFLPNDPTKMWKKQLLENADRIIAISESTKRDIITFSQIDPDKIQVIYLGNPYERLQKAAPITSSSDTSIKGKAYLLFIGSRRGYKNFNFFIEAIAPLLHKSNELHVFCAGGGPFSSFEIKHLQDMNLLSKVHSIKVNETAMIRLYNNAKAFIFPSLYEGFGLPILEAFSCGCPVILSKSSSLPEIAADAACYFDPNDAVSITQSVESVLLDQHYREKIIRKGYDRLKCFSWEKTANETKNVYINLFN